MTTSRTLGVDLASKPKNTAICLIEWGPSGATILPREERQLTDEVLLELLADPRTERVGIDAPFGWPTEFVDAVTKFGVTGQWKTADPKRLEFRETDLHVKSVVGQEPLSVTSDWLVWAAWRCARLLDALEEWEPELRRGEGRYLEVYPAAALCRWNLSPTLWGEEPGSYKGNKPDREPRRARLVELLKSRTEGKLDFRGDEARFVESDHELDALISALMARAASLRQVEPIPHVAGARVLTEGWIQLPLEDGSVVALFA